MPGLIVFFDATRAARPIRTLCTVSRDSGQPGLSLFQGRGSRKGISIDMDPAFSPRKPMLRDQKLLPV